MTTDFSGVLGRLVMFSGQPSDAEILSLAVPVSVTVANDVAIDADEDGPNVTVDALALCHYAGTKAAATVTIPPGGTGTLGVWSVSSNNLVYNPASTPGVDTAGRYTVNGSAPAILTATVDDIIPPPPGGNDHDALVMAPAYQISNAALQAADVYYWSAEINDTVRNTWNNAVNPHRYIFDTTKPSFSTNINAKTRLYSLPYFHEAVIMPATPFVDEVLVPAALSNSGVLRHTIRNKTGWPLSDQVFRNFRKHSAELRLRNPHPAYTSVGSGTADKLLHNQTYESGFTFWQGGHANAFTKVGVDGKSGCAVMQFHGSHAGIYCYISAGLTFAGFYTPQDSVLPDVDLPSFSITPGYNDIHVFKFSVRLSTSGGGHIRVWYNGVQKININNISVTSGTSPFQNICFTYRDPLVMDSSNGRSPSVSGGSTSEGTIYTDRIWRKAV